MRLLPYRDRRQVIEAIAHVLTVVPLENLLSAYQSFVLPIVQRLHELSNIPSQSMTEELAAEATEMLDSFATLSKHLKPEVSPGSSHPCVSVLQETWPIVKKLLSNYGQYKKLTEAGARLLRSSLISYHQHMIPQAPEWADGICAFFETSGSGSWLWVGTRFVRYFGLKGSSTEAVSIALMERMSAKVFSMFSATSDVDSLEEGELSWMNLRSFTFHLTLIL
jgi:transportin-3